MSSMKTFIDYLDLIEMYILFAVRNVVNECLRDFMKERSRARLNSWRSSETKTVNCLLCGSDGPECHTGQTAARRVNHSLMRYHIASIFGDYPVEDCETEVKKSEGSMTASMTTMTKFIRDSDSKCATWFKSGARPGFYSFYLEQLERLEKSVEIEDETKNS